MSNTISTYQVPGFEQYRPNPQVSAAEQSVGSAPVATELGLATTPIREGGAPIIDTQDTEPQPIQYANLGDAIPSGRSEEVMDAARAVTDAFEPQAAPTAPEIDPARMQAAAQEQAMFYGPTVEMMREHALNVKRSDLTLVA